MTPEERQWHWSEGHKYALEGMKTLLLLNGGSAIALLTFFGNRGGNLKAGSGDAIGYALLCFSIGTVGSFLVFFSAYMTQLFYGNGGTAPRSRQATVWHNLTYAAVLTGLVGFISGIWLARAAVVTALS